MNKFQKGDRVAYVAIDGAATRAAGDTGTVVEVKSRDSFAVMWDGPNTSGKPKKPTSHNPAYLRKIADAVTVELPIVPSPNSTTPFTFAPYKPKPMTTGDLFNSISNEPPKPAYLRGKRLVISVLTSMPINALPEWPDYVVEKWQHMINSTSFVSYIRTRVGNTPYEGKLTASLQDIQLTQSIKDGPTVKTVVENMIEICLKQMNDEIELAKIKIKAEQVKIEAAEAKKIKEQIAQQLYEKKLRDAGFMLDDLTQQPLPPDPRESKDEYVKYIQQMIEINRGLGQQQLYMQTQNKTTPQQRNRIKAPTAGDELSRIIEKAFRAYNK
jgi:hypothetical protein